MASGEAGRALKVEVMLLVGVVLLVVDDVDVVLLVGVDVPLQEPDTDVEAVAVPDVESGAPSETVDDGEVV